MQYLTLAPQLPQSGKNHRALGVEQVRPAQ
jgi:hypothetical protein